jgi:hypothetical protein
MNIDSSLSHIEIDHRQNQPSKPKRWSLPAEHRIYPFIALLAALILVVRIVPTIRTFNHTFDEPSHLAAAVGIWQEKKLTLGAEHPPLARLVPGLVLHLMGVRLPPEYDTKTIASADQSFDAGGKILFNSGYGYWTILTRARLAMLVFPLIALFYLYLLARWLSHSREAMLATVFFSLDPTLLGHAMWIATDAAAAAGFLAASYYGLRFLYAPTNKRALAGGIALGAAIACKATAMLLLPALFLILLIRPARALCMDCPWRRRLRVYFRRWPSVRQSIFFLIAAFVILWGLYFFDVGRMANQHLMQNAHHWDEMPACLKQLPIPMPSFFVGTFFQVAHNSAGHHAYLNGHLGYHGWWVYFPEAFILKSPLGLLIALVVAGAFALASIPRWRRTPPKTLVYIIPLVFIAISLRSHINIGVRHLLPVIPFAYLFVAIQLGRQWKAVILGLLILLAAVETASVHPDYIAFFNVLAGGPSGGHRYLVDSNLDWGQDIARLATWLKSDANRGRSYTLRVEDSSETKLIKYLGLDPAALTAEPHGLFAISANVQARLRTFSIGPDYSWVKAYPLVKRVGQSINVYDLDQKPASIPRP